MRTREKTFCGRERPHFWRALSHQNPFGLRGSLPATVCSPRSGEPPSHAASADSCQFLSEQTVGAHMRNPGPTKEKSMPLLKPPEPPSPSASTTSVSRSPSRRPWNAMPSFSALPAIDHVVTEALQFIFKRDNQFKSWLEQNPEPTPKSAKSKAGSKNTAPNGGAQ